jgi:excisionase family DNA binding protein
MTVREVARYLRISPDKVRALVRAKQLGAINTADSRAARPRLVILPHHLDEFVRGRDAAREAPRPLRRKRTPATKDYFPD